MPSIQGRHDLPVSPGSQQREPTKTSDLSSYPWYGGAMERETAEVKLEKLKPGSFIVRDSMRTGGYALSIKYDKLPKHIKIRGTTDKQYYLADSKMFQSIPELVSYYQNNSLSPSFPGVDTTLMYPYKRVQRRQYTYYTICDWPCSCTL
ncbi:proto-oncogene vav-like [Saccoglossus kowalevskii]